MHVTREIYFSLFGRDEPGALAELTADLMHAQIELEGLWGIGRQDGTAEFFAVPRSVERFEAAVPKIGWTIRRGECFRLTGADTIGALVATLKQITAHGINLRSVDALALDGQFGCYIWAHEEDVDRLGEVLEA